MTLKRTLACAVLLAAGSAAPSPARAAIVSWTLDFSASGLGPGVPVDPATGVISITFDNAADLPQTTTGVNLVSSNFTLGSPVAFRYFAAVDTIQFGGTANGVGGIQTLNFDFLLTVEAISTVPVFDEFVYSFGDPSGFSDFTSTGFIEFEPGPGVAVPEPVAVSLFGAGLIGLALTRRRRPTSGDQRQTR
jgi:hypothetical protein